MIKLDLHSLQTDVPDRPVKITSGYALAFQDLRNAIYNVIRHYPGIRLVREFSGGDIQVYFGTVWDNQRKLYERKSDIFLVFTMFEYSRLPEEWFKHLAEFDGIIVPSDFCKTIFESELERKGINIPVWKVPLGINPQRWHYIPRDRNGKGDFNIFWQGTFYGDRKGGEIAVAAFEKLKLPNAKMTIKINPRYLTHGTEWDMSFRPPKDPTGFNAGTNKDLYEISVRSIGKVYKQEQTMKLLGDMDLSVYPATGEGLGLIPLEHMATGLPVILSNNTGMSEFCNPLFNMPVQCTEIQSYYGPDMGVGYLPNIDQVAAYIQWAYENREDAKEMGLNASSWIRGDWNCERSAEKFLDLIMEVSNVGTKLGKMAQR